MNEEIYNRIKVTSLTGRYITLEHIMPVLENLPSSFSYKVLGKSASGKSIGIIKAGQGPHRILAWSQMHGNESTTTKAALDFLNWLGTSDHEVERLLSKVTLYVIPILNPDGASNYTRVNQNGVDLNRDALKLSQPESKILRQAFEEIKPHYCFNLHDQRTIFSAGDTNRPATISFLAPSVDSAREISGTREQAMKIIVGMKQQLPSELSDQIGRYDDSFNPNCTGDRFQQQVPTILFEAGHSPGDYQREETRRYIFFAIFSAVQQIATQNFHSHDREIYFSIPENHKNFVDILLRNVNLNGEITDVGIQFEEKLHQQKIVFEPKIHKIAKELPLFGHFEKDCKGQKVLLNEGHPPAENDLVTQIMLNGDNLLSKIE